MNMLRRFLILIAIVLIFNFFSFAGGKSSGRLNIGIPGMLNPFDFEDGTIMRWEIDPTWCEDLGTNVSSLVAISNSGGWAHSGSMSLAFYIDCSIKDGDGELAGKGRVKAIDHTDLTPYKYYKVHFKLQLLQGTWGSDWLFINLFFWRKKDNETWHGVFKGWTGLTPTYQNPLHLSWDISVADPGIGYSDPEDRDFVSEIGFEIRAGRNTSVNARAILYVDLVKFTE